MSAKTSQATVLALVALVAGYFAFAVSPHGGVSAGPTTIPWTDVLKLVAGIFGGGAWLSWLGKLGPLLDIFKAVTNQTTTTTDAKTDVKTDPIPLQTDTVELVQAATNYVNKRDDKAAQARFIQAALAEIRDIVAIKFPAIAGPLNALAVAITNALFPSTPSAS